jgi:hypothetical protein
MAVVVTKQSTDIYVSVGNAPSVISYCIARDVACTDGQFEGLLEIVARDVEN